MNQEMTERIAETKELVITAEWCSFHPVAF